MGMSHVTSGRANLTYQHLYTTKPSVPPKSFIPKSLLKRMLIRENELRLSSDYQQRYQDIESDPMSTSSWLDVTDELQRQVIREFQLDEDVEEALNCLRCATQIYPELSSIPLYVRYNRARDGDLKEGETVPDVPIVELDSKETTLYQHLKNQPTVLISGSYS